MFGQNKPSYPHENDGMDIQRPSPSVSSHMDAANGFSEHIISSFSEDQQNEILLHIQKRMIEHRRQVLTELELNIKAAQGQYEKVMHSLNVIS